MDTIKGWFGSANGASGIAAASDPGVPTLATSVQGLESSALPPSGAASSTAPRVSPAALLAGGAALAAGSFLAVRLLRYAKFLDPMVVRRGKEEQLLCHVIQHAKEGDADHVIDTIDQFCYAGSWMMHVGDKKGRILDEEIKKRQPKIVVELGAYCGYSALRIARLLPEGGHLYSIELDPLHAAIATKIVEWAGLASKVTVLVGTTETKLPTLQSKYGVKIIDLLFLDHAKAFYLSDLKRFEEAGLIQRGSVLVADNCLYPGCPDYVEYIRSNANYISMCHDAYIEYDSSVKDQVWVSQRK